MIPDIEFGTFEEAFADIKRRRSWFRLHISNPHKDYRDLIEREIQLATNQCRK